MKHSKEKNTNNLFKIIIIVTIINVVLFAGNCVMFVMGANNLKQSERQTPPAPSSQAPTPPMDEKPSEKTSSSKTSASKEAKTEYPKELTSILKKAGISKSELEKTKAKELVCVVPEKDNKTAATISYFSVQGDKWIENKELKCQGNVGEEGTVDNMSEQISGTPRGLYTIGDAFYQNEIPKTRLNAFQITENTYWISDPNSQFYNQRVEGTENQDWNNAEHMIEIPEYKYGFVINYNTPAKPGKGSAIFFHIGEGATQGCVSTNEEMVKRYLAELNKEDNPCILVL